MQRRHFLLVPSLLAAQQPPRPVPVVAPRRRDVPIGTFGTPGEGKIPDTQVIQAAIDSCSAQGGGTIRFPAGRYLSGSLLLKKGVTLHLAEGAVLLGSPNPFDYKSIDPFRDGTGGELGFAFIGALDTTDVGIEGSGVIDGQGKEVLAALGKGERSRRPFLLRFVRCANVSLKDVKLRQSAVWTCHLSQCHNVTVERVNINSHAGANNDGIDIDSCELVRVSDCDIDTGDDSICLKTTSRLPCRDVTITNCRLKSNCATIKAGTESVGDFENIRISKCQLMSAGLGGIKLLTVDGARMQDIEITDTIMLAGHIPIFLRLGGRLKTFRSADAKREVGVLRNVTIRNFRATAEGPGVVLSGIPGHRIEGIRILDLDFTLKGGGAKEDAAVELPEEVAAYPETRMFGKTWPASFLYARHVEGLEVSGVKVAFEAPDGRPLKVLVDAEKVTTEEWK